MIFPLNYDGQLTEFLLILFDTILAFVIVPMWISSFSRLREIEKKMAILEEKVRWIFSGHIQNKEVSRETKQKILSDNF